MPRRSPRDDRKAKHHRPGRNKSSRAKLASRSDESPDVEVFRFSRSGGLDGPRKSSSKTSAVVCPKGKRGFPKHVAQARLEQFATSDRPNKPVRIYECPDCGFWHLTSRLHPPSPRPPAPGVK